MAAKFNIPNLNKYDKQSNNCGMQVYVLGYPDFKYTISWLLRHLFPPFFKMVVVNTNVAISQTLGHILLTLLDSLVDSELTNAICHLQHHNNSRHFLKMASLKAYYFRI